MPARYLASSTYTIFHNGHACLYLFKVYPPFFLSSDIIFFFLLCHSFLLLCAQITQIQTKQPITTTKNTHKNDRMLSENEVAYSEKGEKRRIKEPLAAKPGRRKRDFYGMDDRSIQGMP